MIRGAQLQQQPIDADHPPVSNQKDIFQKMRNMVLGMGSKSDELRYGDQLQDDLINSFCDKLQTACPYKIEALFAIQFLHFSDQKEIESSITGKSDAFQVVYDNRRRHYILFYFEPDDRVVHIYDSMQMYDSAGNPFLFDEIVDHLYRLFGHLFKRAMRVQFDKNFEQQQDGFSCGYRVIGALISLARGEDPSRLTYSRSRILHFMQDILDEPSPDWDLFVDVELGREKEYSKSGIVQMLLHFEPREPPVESTEKTQSVGATPSGSLHSLSTLPEVGESMLSLDYVAAEEMTDDEEENELNYSLKISDLVPSEPAPIVMDSTVFSAFRRMFTAFSLFGKNHETMEDEEEEEEGEEDADHY